MGTKNEKLELLKDFKNKNLKFDISEHDKIEEFVENSSCLSGLMFY